MGYFEFTTNDWLELLENNEDTVDFSENKVSKDLLRVFKTLEKTPSFTDFEELSDKYGFIKEYYIDNLEDYGNGLINDGYFEVVNKPNGERDNLSPFFDVIGGKYTLKSALKEAIENIEFEGSLYSYEEEPKNYWWLNASPKIWSFNNISKDESQLFTRLSENGNPRRIAKNYAEISVCDVVLGYETNPVKKVVTLGTVSGVTPKGFYFKKNEQLQNAIDYLELKKCEELKNFEFFKNPNGSLFKLSEDEYQFILDKIRENNSTKRVKYDTYNENDFLNDVYMSDADYKELLGILKSKKNIILQGAPGVGKTFSAVRLAYSMMGEKNTDRIEKVQFHQNYSYEDFVMGYKPVEDGYELRNGIFYNFCTKAMNDPKNSYFFIIDEINRGNLSKIFGELLMLIENDYRGKENRITLAYNGLSFYVPENLYIIGMMNTADRSLAMMDYALRRRFSFFEMKPGFDSAGFVTYQNSLGNVKFNNLISVVKDLNNAIRTDKSLGSGFELGHSYFCGQKSVDDEWLKSVVKYDLIPTLKEYWFDKESEWQGWEAKLLAAVR